MLQGMKTNNTLRHVFFCAIKSRYYLKINYTRRVLHMPKTKLQDLVFTLMMVFVMVYGMVCYNIALDRGAMTNDIFLLAFGEMVIMYPIAFIAEFFIVGKLAQKLAFRFVTPGKDNMIFVILAISSMTVCLMCPIMSFFAALLFKHPGIQLIAVWIEVSAKNFPMALCFQIFFAGPFVRLIFRHGLALVKSGKREENVPAEK